MTTFWVKGIRVIVFERGREALKRAIRDAAIEGNSPESRPACADGYRKDASTREAGTA